MLRVSPLCRTSRTQMILAVFALACLMAAPPVAQADEAATPAPEGQALALELARLTSPSAQETGDLMRLMLSQSHPDEPSELWDQLIANVDFDELERRIAPVYAKHLSAETMRDTITFYKTPAGQRWIEKQTEIAGDTMLMTQEWLMPIITELLDEAFASGAVSDGPTADKYATRETVSDLRNTGTAMMSWLTDQIAGQQHKLAGDGSTGEWGFHKEGSTSTTAYRVVSYDTVKTLLVPDYLQELPQHDGWGHPYQFAVNENLISANVLAVRSPGKDGTFDSDDYTVGPFPADEIHHDLAWADGYFVIWPE
ncbi:MAG: DUF2059 domain-containing protein [Acidobacteriota bacterium]